jgi:VanZ family protein
MREELRGAITVTQLNFIFYVLLLIMTPFLLLQNYLQTAMGIASNSMLELGAISIPWTVIIALILLSVLLIIVRKKLRWRHPVVLAIVLFLFWAGQQMTDYYFNHKFYELQHNWHYIAYSGFAIVSWRFWKAKGKTAAQIIGYTILFAISASTLDEIAQVPLSNRVFDVCDIAKDTYGSVGGCIVVFFLLEDGKNMHRRLKLTHPTIKGYLSDPLTLLFYEFIFALLFIILSSTLSDMEYFPISFFLPLGVFLLIWLVIHLMQFKVSKIVLTGLLSLAVVGLLVSFIINKDRNITYNKYGLTIYRGIPIPFLDVMISQRLTVMIDESLMPGQGCNIWPGLQPPNLYIKLLWIKKII